VSPNSSQNWLRSLPYWFAAIAGLVYATGFLIEFTFLNSLGVSDAGTDVFKAKYIYVGLLCLQLPVSAGVLVLGFLRMKRKAAMTPSKEDDNYLAAYAPSLISMLVLVATFYLLIAFSRSGQGAFHDHQVAIGSLFGVVIVGLIATRGLQDRLIDLGKSDAKVKTILEKLGLVGKTWNRIRWFLAVVAFALMVYIFWFLARILGEMFIEGGYFYIALMSLVGMLLWRIDTQSDKYREAGLYPTVWVMAACVCGALMYLSTLAFAVRVYPFIPVNRGGGDYTTESTSVLTFDPDFASAIPKNLVDVKAASFQSNPVMILHDATETIFVAEKTETNGPEQWRRTGRQNKPQVIYSLKRSAVISITRTQSPNSGQD
jgi:hypothetical protein